MPSELGPQFAAWYSLPSNWLRIGTSSTISEPSIQPRAAPVAWPSVGTTTGVAVGGGGTGVAVGDGVAVGVGVGVWVGGGVPALGAAPAAGEDTAASVACAPGVAAVT